MNAAGRITFTPTDTRCAYLSARAAAIAPAESAITIQKMYRNAFDCAGSPVAFADAAAGLLCAAAIPIASASRS